MNPSGILAFFLAVVFAIASGFPAVEKLRHEGLHIMVKEDVTSPELPELTREEVEDAGIRFRRATCDLLSVSLPIGSLNHAACAAHCLAMRKGFKGGRCRDGVCHCRR